MKIIIPARLGSKGLPFKNRLLFAHTAESIPKDRATSVWVTSDDPVIQAEAYRRNFNVIIRPDSLATDEVSTREVMVHAIEKIKPAQDELIAMLYLTYPQRTWEEIQEAVLFFLEMRQTLKTGSLLCKKEVKTHPYLCLQEHGVGGIYGKQLIHHDLYRRQDYPKFFEISHYISLFVAGEIYNLNSNLYCDTTVFYPIGDVLDIDTPKELDYFNGRE